MIKANQPIEYIQFRGNETEAFDVDVIVEQPVSLTVNGEVWLAFMCTPVDLEAMAVGFLYNEGLIHSRDEVVSVRACPSGENVDVWLNHSLEKPEDWRRTSGCTGGVTSVDGNAENAGLTGISENHNGIVLTPGQIGSLIGQLFEVQDLYRRSGGVHTSALSDGREIYVTAEDIGRHNTLDKIAGRCLLEGIVPKQRILLTTGRISSEMMQKSARLGASMVISRTSPSSLSIEMAEKWGITLIGYAHRSRFNVYTHPKRIASQADLVKSES
jgi:FdhD protein